MGKGGKPTPSNLFALAKEEGKSFFSKTRGRENRRRKTDFKLSFKIARLNTLMKSGASVGGTNDEIKVPKKKGLVLTRM